NFLAVLPPIGKPIDNVQLYILDDTHIPVPIGVAGDLYIGGVQVAHGYLNLTELSIEKFLPDYFSEKPGSRLYKTGDLARWQVDGNIEYLGRKDDQVKIRGFRVELGEVESMLLQTGKLSQAVVVAKEDSVGSTKLVAYFVPQWKDIKIKEKELYQSQVTTWKEVYETEYASATGENGEEEFNINIWKDSFTGQPIAAVQMKEWLQDIVDIILRDNPENILEIGSGTGLIYYQLAGKIKKYIGTDFSRASIDLITQRISKGSGDYGTTKLYVCAAHEIALDKDEPVDTIVLNSVIQYFPGEDYTTDVISKSISLLHGKGRIIIGDVRDNRLLKSFKMELDMQKLSQSVTVDELSWLAEQEVLKEEELCFSPEYFYTLASLYPEITQVEIMWKQASYVNELSKYRYNVVLYVGINRDVIEPEWQLWKGLPQKQHLIDQVQKNESIIALQDVPNPKLWQEKTFAETLKNKKAGTIGELQQVILKENKGIPELEQILAIALSAGYHSKFLLNEDPFMMNIVLELQPSAKFIKQVYSEKPLTDKTSLTNIPLFTDIGLLMQKDIRYSLQQSLPEYMVPAEFIAVARLPITNN
ncbi:MAG: methyltransferase domain-containing protein, partial [Ferruginibacter sp.]